MTNSPSSSAKNIAFLGLPIKAGARAGNIAQWARLYRAHVQRDGFTVVDVRDPRPNPAKVTQSSSPGMD